MVSISIHSMVRPCADSSGPTTATLFSILQAATHSPQPVHLFRSMTIPHLGMGLCLLDTDISSKNICNYLDNVKLKILFFCPTFFCLCFCSSRLNIVKLKALFEYCFEYHFIMIKIDPMKIVIGNWL